MTVSNRHWLFDRGILEPHKQREELGGNVIIFRRDVDFVKQVVPSLDNFVKKNLRLSEQRIDIEKVAEKTELKYDVSTEELVPPLLFT